MNYDKVMKKLKSMANPRNVEGMARYGINPENNLGASVTEIRNYAREVGKNHDLAQKLWKTGIRDARMLAACIDEPDKVTEKQMEDWVKEFNSWDLCDHCCGHLFDKTMYGYKKAFEWAGRKEEFVKRAGFALMAWLPVHDKKADDKKFEEFLPIILRESTDGRNYVKKAVNWSLRNIGKRNLILNKKAVEAAEKILKIESKTAKWIANDALRELTSKKIQERLKR
jgi:3-methyladenine DNA glycosylase AlkD